MRLKILIVPFFLVMMLILSIGYIKPDFDGILEKRASISDQEALLKNMDSILANVETMKSSLDTNKAQEDFLLHYLPYTIDQDQTIDAFNYLAAQSGLIITDMGLKVSPEVVSTTAVSDGSTTPVPAAPEAKTFVFTGNVFGSYENIKAFLNRVIHMGRFQKVQLFSIEKEAQAADSKSTTSDLKGTFITEYGYLPKKAGVSALNTPVFLHDALNFSEVDSLKEKITSIPTLERGQSGKPNPFQ